MLAADRHSTQSPPDAQLEPALPPGACCVFLQMQHIQRGACVARHIDAPSPPADAVATLALGEGRHDTVRVGEVIIPLQAGDLYLISGSARWEVDHEVHSSTSDRLSVTLRYVRDLDMLKKPSNVASSI